MRRRSLGGYSFLALALCLQALIASCAGSGQPPEPPEPVDPLVARCTAPLEGEGGLEECQAKIPVFAYSSARNDCYMYTFGGCRDSSPRNRFNTYDDCARQCVKAAPTSGEESSHVGESRAVAGER